MSKFDPENVSNGCVTILILLALPIMFFLTLAVHLIIVSAPVVFAISVWVGVVSEWSAGLTAYWIAFLLCILFTLSD